MLTWYDGCCSRLSQPTASNNHNHNNLSSTLATQLLEPRDKSPRPAPATPTHGDPHMDSTPAPRASTPSPTSEDRTLGVGVSNCLSYLITQGYSIDVCPHGNPLLGSVTVNYACVVSNNTTVEVDDMWWWSRDITVVLESNDDYCRLGNKSKCIQISNLW